MRYRKRDAGDTEKTEGGKGERECFGKSTESLKPSHFSWKQYPVSLLWYLHTKPIRASSAAADLSSPEPVRRSGLEPAWFGCLVHDQKVYFLTRLVVGTEAAVQNQGSHRLTEKHRGQGLRNRESCDATVLTLMTSAASLTRSGIWRKRWRKRERKRALPVQRDPSEGSFSSMLGLQRPLCVTIDRAAPGSHSGAPLYGASTQFPLRPRGSLKTYKRHLQRQSHYLVDL